MRLFSLIFFILFLIFSKVFSHDGAPYPIVVNKKIQLGTISIFADPDLKDGKFFIYLTPFHSLENKETEEILLQSHPTSESAHKIYGSAQKVVDNQEQNKYLATLPFDSEGNWETQFIVKQKEGNSEILTLTVEVTPNGPSKLEFLLYFLPFLLMGFVWGKAFIAKKT